MQGYFDNPEATAETITADGWLLTPEVTIPSYATEISVGSDGTVSIVNGETGDVMKSLSFKVE